jgi:hypothetical protein
VGTLAFMPVRLRYGFNELMLVQPGNVVLAPPSPDVLLIRALIPKPDLLAPAPLRVEAALLALDACHLAIGARVRSLADLFWLIALSVIVTWRRPRKPWPAELQLAALLIRTFNRRRAWERAYAAARASQDLSSASSSTSAVWAPDTP